ASTSPTALTPIPHHWVQRPRNRRLRGRHAASFPLPRKRPQHRRTGRRHGPLLARGPDNSASFIPAADPRRCPSGRLRYLARLRPPGAPPLARLDGCRRAPGGPLLAGAPPRPPTRDLSADRALPGDRASADRSHPRPRPGGATPHVPDSCRAARDRCLPHASRPQRHLAPRPPPRSAPCL
ncbi:MAG: hypothetical protein AVDCRST_MAG77-2578, partial [uncultured Chloroflexi bacterium]